MPDKIELKELDTYWRERVTVEMDRLTCLVIVGAGILALRHPEYTGPSSLILRDTLRRLVPLCYEPVPEAVLREWDQVLHTSFL